MDSRFTGRYFEVWITPLLLGAGPWETSVAYEIHPPTHTRTNTNRGQAVWGGASGVAVASEPGLLDLLAGPLPRGHGVGHRHVGVQPPGKHGQHQARVALVAVQPRGQVSPRAPWEQNAQRSGKLKRTLQASRGRIRHTHTHTRSVHDSPPGAKFLRVFVYI